jgi:benzoate-CoA ligase
MPGPAEIQLPERFNAADFFVEGNLRAGRASRTAFRYQGRSYTYQETSDLVSHAAAALREMGLLPEQRILLILPDSPDFVALFFGAIKAGIVPVPLHTLVGPEELRYYLEDSSAKAVFVHPLFVERLQPALPPETVLAGEAWEQRLAATRPMQESAATHRDDMAFWLYTSGSTGRPKGAVHLQRDMVYSADWYAVPVQGLTAEDRIFSASKMFFAFGLGNSLYCPFRVGACSVLLPERPTAERCLEVIQQERPTIFYAVPTLYAAILSVPDAEKRYDLSSLRLAVSAGEALPAELYRRFLERFGVEILDGIGSTEMLHVFITNRAGEVRPGSIGRPVPGYRARIVDDQGMDLPRGEVGNLWISGPSAAAFYWRKVEQTRQTMRGEWLVTGDKYRQDDGGFYWYCGRADDMLKVGAQWVSPMEVEAALIAHQAVLESAVVAASDPQGLTYPKAFVVLRSGCSATAGELLAWLQETLPRFKVPREILFVDELPKTATGKIQRFKLRSA